MSEDAHQLAATVAASHEALVQEAYERGKRHGRDELTVEIRNTVAATDGPTGALFAVMLLLNRS